MRSVLIAMVAALSLMSFGANAASELTAGQTRMKECAAEWSEHKAKNGTPAKGEGRDAWNKFRSECVVRKGGKSKFAAPVKAS